MIQDKSIGMGLSRSIKNKGIQSKNKWIISEVYVIIFFYKRTLCVINTEMKAENIQESPSRSTW